MKKIFVCIFAVIVLLLVVAMCVKARSSRDRDMPPAVAQESRAEVLPDSVVALLTVCVPDSVPSQLIQRTAYLTSYNSRTRCPNWVAWQITAEHADGPYRRMRQFHEENEVAAPRATLDDYRGSGWTRGHMCPAGDNKWSRRAMYESFSLANVCPQNASLNNGLWNSVEMDCRKWARRYGEIYVVCGPLYLNREHERIGANAVAVPEAFFKVVLCLAGTPKAFGFIARNNDGQHKRDLYYNSVDQIERVTGYDFFSSLPDDVEDAVEAEIAQF